MSLYGSNKFLASAGGGVPIYPNLAGFPATAGIGALGVAADTGILYEFNGTAWQPIASNASYVGGINAITGLTGDGTATGPGNVALTLATVNPNVGTFGTSSDVPVFTVNGKGLITALVEIPIQITESQVTNLVTDLASKVAISSLGNLTDAGTDGIIITGGTGAVVGNVSIAQTVSDATHNGYLSATDWATFNGKQPAGNYITALTGDATALGPGSVAITLATVNTTTGSFGSATAVSTFTVNSKGLVTVSGSTPIQITESQVTGLVADLASKVATASLGNLTDAGTDGIVVTGGTGAVVGTVSLAQHVADATHNGYLASTDFVTFNAKQPAGNYITSLSTDVVATGPGAASATIQPNVVSNSKLAQMPTLTIKGNNTGATANALDLTVVQVNAILPVFTSSLNGLVPASGGGTTTFLRADGTFAAPAASTLITPKVTIFTSGSGTFTKTGTPLYIRVRMAGGGGGGSGSTSITVAAGNGGNTSFGTSLLLAGGGLAGSNTGTAGQGGATTIAAGPLGMGWTGGDGSPFTGITGASGGTGGSNSLGGAGMGGGGGLAGGGAKANTGAGGGGGGSSVGNSGGGGGAGGYIDVIINSPSSTYSYLVALAGTAGSGSNNGGTGGSGWIEVTEFYQ